MSQTVAISTIACNIASGWRKRASMADRRAAFAAANRSGAVTKTPTASPIQKRIQALPNPVPPSRPAALSTPMNAAPTTPAPATTTMTKIVSCRVEGRSAPWSRDLNAHAMRRVAARKNEGGRRGDCVPAWRMPYEHIPKHDGGQHDRGVHQASQHHPDDGQRGLRVPRGDVERTDWIDVAGPVEHEVARRKDRRIAQISKESSSANRILHDARHWASKRSYVRGFATGAAGSGHRRLGA